MPWIDNRSPRKVRKVKPVWTADGYLLFWTAPKAKKPLDEARRYAVYRFLPGEEVKLSSPTRLVAVTSDTFLKLPYTDGNTRYTYVVTALDRMSNESKAQKKKIKL